MSLLILFPYLIFEQADHSSSLSTLSPKLLTMTLHSKLHWLQMFAGTQFMTEFKETELTYHFLSQ